MPFLYLIALFALFAYPAQGQAVKQTAGIKRTVTKTERIPFGAGGTVTVAGAPLGAIRIKPSAGNEVVINAKIEIQADNEAELAKLTEITGYITEESLSRIAITAVGAHTKGIFKKIPKKTAAKLASLPYSIDFEIEVPKYCDLVLNGGKGDLTVEGLEGSLSVNFIESAAVIRIISGAVNITVGQGSVDIALGTKGWRARTADVSVAKGDIIASFPANFSAELDAVILRTGAIYNIIEGMTPRDRKVEPTERLMQMKAGVGGPRVKFTVGDGSIRLLPFEI
ncbi:MAG: hypothetical protein KF881_03215 [Acidobacteria bacterium]|nr:hypothetical protein [Acidobacteriota bacterium]